MKNLSNPFTKGKSTKNEYGTGLGLYVVSQILNQLGSELKCVSEVRKGTTYSFFQKTSTYCHEDEFVIDVFNHDSLLIDNNSKILTMKLEDQDFEVLDQTTLNFARGELRKGSQNNSTYFRTKENMDKQPCINQETTETLVNNLSIPYYIVVDDEKYTRQATLRVLKQTANKLKINCLFVEVEDGMECLSSVYNLLKDGKKIFGVISDEMMKHMNGSTTAEILKKLKNLNSQYIPFYLLSALTDFNNNYVDLFISKPLVEKEARKIFNNNV